MSTYNDRIQHTCPTGGRALSVADDAMPERDVRGIFKSVNEGFKNFMRSRGLLDEKRQSRLEKQAAKARKVKALRRACK